MRGVFILLGWIMLGVIGCGKTTPLDQRPLAAAVIAVQTSSAQLPERVLAEATSQTKAKSIPRVQCWIFSTAACPPCELLKQDIQQTLAPIGWQIGSSPEHAIRLLNADDSAGKPLAERHHISQYPTILILADGKETERIMGRISAVDLSWRLRHAERKLAPLSVP